MAVPIPSRAAARALRCEEGAAILEFALTLPLLVAVLAGAFELGRGLLVRHVMTEAVRGGARSLARVPDPVCRAACPPGAARALTLARDQIANGALRRGETVDVVSEWDGTRATVTVRATVRLDADLLPLVGLAQVLRVETAHREAWVGE